MLAAVFQRESGFVSAHRCVCVCVSDGRGKELFIVLRPGGDDRALND